MFFMIYNIAIILLSFIFFVRYDILMYVMCQHDSSSIERMRGDGDVEHVTNNKQQRKKAKKRRKKRKKQV